MTVLQYRAGAQALALLQKRGGLSPEDVCALVLPAIGPKWLVLYGIDSALVRAGFLEAAARKRRVLLFGASAGAWRGLALAARDPARAIDALRDLYCEQHFTTQDSPEAISGSIGTMSGSAPTSRSASLWFSSHKHLKSDRLIHGTT